MKQLKKVKWLKRLANLLLIIIGWLLNIVALYLIFKAFLPIAKWYWEAVPVRGVDLLNASTYVAYLKRNFAILPASWKYIWFSGQPLYIDYPSFNFYLALPFTEWFTAVQSIQLWMLVSTFLYFIFSYLLFAKLAKSRAFALVLTVLAVYSVNVYGALIWGGSIPYYGSQFFLPLTLYLLVYYAETGKRRWFSGAVLALGISQYGHPQIALSYGLIFSLLTLLLAPRIKKVKIKGRIFDVFIFCILVFAIGMPVTSRHLHVFTRIPEQILSGVSGEIPVSYQATPGPEVSEDILNFYRTRIYHFYSDTHFWLSWIAGISVVLFLLVYFSTSFIRTMINKKKKTKTVFSLLWATSLVGYVGLYLYIYSIGIDLFHGGWYRVFWPVPLVVGVLAAVSFGGVLELIGVYKRRFLLNVSGLFLDGFLVFILFSVLGSLYIKNFEDTLFLKSNASAGFPGSVIASISKEDQEEFANQAVPDWVPVNSYDYRLYNADQTYNMWFNTYYDLPLARGYIDVPVNHWGGFLTDILLDNDIAEEEFDYTEEVAIKASKFVLDWNAIRYLAGENYGPGSYVSKVFPSYIYGSDFTQRDEVWTTLGSRLAVPGDVRGDIYDPTVKNSIRYLELKEELVSPILSFSDTPAVLFVGDFQYWEIFIRTLAQMGMTSKDLIPVRGPKYVDELSIDDLAQFDAVILYGYDYKDHGKAWGLISDYVERGGALIIDTGAEVKESASVDLPSNFSQELPSLFPIARTHREKLGFDWRTDYSLIYEGIDTNLFSPLLYDEEIWKVSYADSGDVEGAAEVILTLYGKPVIANWAFGEGTVLWSGLNFPAHIERYKNPEEGKLFKQMISGVVVANQIDGERGNAEFISSEQRKISGKGARGVLFKESAFDGWKAKLYSGVKTESLKIWPAGLGDPGMMWVNIPEYYRGKPIEVEFKFQGAITTWLSFMFSTFIGILLFDNLAFNSKIFGRLLGKIGKFVGKKMGRWWEHEEI